MKILDESCGLARLQQIGLLSVKIKLILETWDWEKKIKILGFFNNYVNMLLSYTSFPFVPAQHL